MANTQTISTQGVKRKVPINRNNLFYSDSDYDFELETGKDYIEQDMNQTIVLYQVDVKKSNPDMLYGETNTDQVSYFPPVEVPCVYKIEQPQLKAYEKQKNIGTYVQNGKLTVGVYQETLDELGVDIKKGDYIGIQIDETRMVFYSVVNDGKNNTDNAHTLFGIKPLYRTIQASAVDETQFKG